MIPVWWSVALTVLGGLGWLLVTVDRRIHGFCVGLLAQVAWIAYAVTTAQWGFLGSATLFGAINALGVHRWLRARRATIPDAWGAREAHQRPPGGTQRYQHQREFPAPLPSRPQIERVMRAELDTVVALNGYRVAEGEGVAFRTAVTHGGVLVTARARVVPIAHHDTAAMQRGDGERLIPPVPPTHREDPSR